MFFDLKETLMLAFFFFSSRKLFERVASFHIYLTITSIAL